MLKLRAAWDGLRSSLWFLPAVLIALGVALAVGMIELEAVVDRKMLQERWPRLFGAGAAGSRAMLASIAGSMITVAGVVFSITIVALSLASSQYSSRVLRNFMRDRANQTVLGSFLGIFVYCLVVLRTIRGGDEGAFVPTLAVSVAVLLAFVGIGFLIFFIHHIASNIQAEHVLETARRETIDAIDRLFPEELGDSADEQVQRRAPDAEQSWRPVLACRTGVIQGIESQKLLELACEHNVIARMERGIGEFIIERTPILSIAGPIDLPDDELASKVDGLFAIGAQRTMVQDAAFGIRQIVDVALKALSPGVNDTTTAVMCIHHLAAVMSRLAGRRIESPYRQAGGRLRVIARGPTFASMLGDSFDQIRRTGAENVNILHTLLWALRTIASCTSDAARRRALHQHSRLVMKHAQRADASPSNRDPIDDDADAPASLHYSDDDAPLPAGR